MDIERFGQIVTFYSRSCQAPLRPAGAVSVRIKL
jgi:hypothetical protein